MLGLGPAACQTVIRDGCPCAEPANLAGQHWREPMRLVLFQASGRDEPVPGLLTERGVVDISDLVVSGYTPQITMQNLIDGFERLRPALERRAADGEVLPLDSVRLRAPMPRPGKVLCCIANYWEHAQREARPLNMFLKNPE